MVRVRRVVQKVLYFCRFEKYPAQDGVKMFFEKAYSLFLTR